MTCVRGLTCLICRVASTPEQEWTAHFLALRLGRWIVALVGIGFICFCFYELRRAYADGFNILEPEGMTSEAQTLWATRLAQVGIGARAAVFAMIGVFLTQAAINYDPSSVRGLSGALTELKRQPYGPWLLATVALGLIAYGAYMLFMCWSRRINPP